MMGVAVGCVGMSLDDFCALDFDEFEAVTRAWTEMRESQERQEWERMRMLATIGIQPHAKKKLTPAQLLPFPWDREEKEKRDRKAAPKSSPERFRRIAERMARMNGV